MQPADPLPASQAGHSRRTPLQQCGDIHPNPGPQLKCPYCGKRAGAGTIQCTVCGNWSHMRCVGVRSHNLPPMHICKECQEQPWECQVCNKNCYFSSTQCSQCGKWTHDGCSKGKGEPPQFKCIKCHKPKNRTKPRDIKICQLNCNGLKARRTELEKMLTETMPDVVLLQETLLRSGMEYNPPPPPQGYTTADKKDGVPYDNKPRAGVLTLVKEDLPFTKVAKSENTWTDFVTIKLDTADTLVANVYIPPENSKATEDWQQVLNGHQGTGRLIMAGDMNAHEHWDNFLDEDKRGTEFAEWMQSNALEASNDPNVHTRTSPNSGGRSSLDLTLASNQLIDNVRESWETGEDVGSDHFPIFFRLGTKFPPPRRRKPRFVFKNARWEGFRESLSAKSERGNSVNECYKHLVQDILKAAKENIPMGALQGRTKPFWSSKCQELVTARNEARKAAEQTGTEADVKAFKLALSVLKTGKAPRPDEITNEMLKNLDKATKSRLLKLFNWALREGVSPAGWRRSTIIPVHKKGKPRDDPSSYRPVGLTSCMAKLMERMVATRLVYHLESQKILAKCQAGFRKNRSTEEQIARIVQDAFDGLEQKKPQRSVLVLLDFSRAYDRVWKSALYKKMADCQVHGDLIRWTKSFLDDKRGRFKWSETLSKERLFREGLPQGSVLAPTLWLIYWNDLPSHISAA